MSDSPTQSTPGGCFLGFLGLLPASFGVIGIWGMLKWITLPDGSRSVDALFWMIVAALTVGWGGAAILWFWAIRALRNTDFRGYNSRDPDRTGLKW